MTTARHRSHHPYRGHMARSPSKLDDDHNVVDARLHVVEFRGYEKFIQGPSLLGGPDTDAAYLRYLLRQSPSRRRQGARRHRRGRSGVRGCPLTPTALKMRRLGHYAQMLQSHVTAYFYLVLPEMLFGIDARARTAQCSRTDRGGSRAGQASSDAAQVGSGNARCGLRQTDARHLVRARRREQEPDRRRRR